jgi:hypothetical protein
VWSRSLSRSLHWCTPSNPSTISPIEILSSDLLVEWNEFGQYWRRCVELCDWIFQAILLTSTMCWAWIHDGYKTEWAAQSAVGVFKKESIVGTLPDGYLLTSPLPRINTRKYWRVPPVSRDYLGLHSSQPSLPSPICVWANRCSHNMLTTTVIATGSVCMFNSG